MGMATCKDCEFGGSCVLLHKSDSQVCNIFTHKKDYVEVVRCKDCKHFKETNGKFSGKPCGYGQCMKPFFIQMIVNADDFCSYGERREGE